MTDLDFAVNEKALPLAQRAPSDLIRKKAIYAEDEQIRAYPNRFYWPPMCSVIPQWSKKRLMTVGSGKSSARGIEQTFNTRLAGVRGWRRTELDRKQREVLSLREQDVEAEDGVNVVLTIDSVIQHIVETSLARAMEKHSPLTVSGIVIRPRTGEVLAMATLPSYDPGNLTPLSAAHIQNPVITTMAEPGSQLRKSLWYRAR